jgi:hydroxymethylpyrimidine pyrophosphatase-like HAD family hydrolase
MKRQIVFSDLDGTLVHYQHHFKDFGQVVDTSDPVTQKAWIREVSSGLVRECIALPSLTSGTGFISCRTIDLVQDLRKQRVLFCIVTGARSSTFFKRKPFLPESDFAVFENGGIILHHEKVDLKWWERFLDVHPDVISKYEAQPPPESRRGILWDVFRDLASKGWEVDARDYWTAFRVSVSEKNLEEWALLTTEFGSMGLNSAFNLGKADVFPAASGKANAARYLMELESIKIDDSVALFDDDNDIELGHLCGRSILPGITHPKVKEILEGDMKERWSLTKARGVFGAEEALDRLLHSFKDE